MTFDRPMCEEKYDWAHPTTLILINGYGLLAKWNLDFEGKTPYLCINLLIVNGKRARN